MHIWLCLLILPLAALLFQARPLLAQILCERRMRAGDYHGALRRLRWIGLGIPNVFMLHKEALILSLYGRPAEAEPLYRTALGMLRKGVPYPRERLHSSLGYALLDLGRYPEAEQCFHRAIEAGDATGNSQDGLAELRLTQGVEIEKALAYSRYAIERAKRRTAAEAPGVYYVHEAWALALLGRTAEASASLAQALHAPAREGRANASLHWRAGTVLSILQQPAEARRQFQLGANVDAHGKYGARCARDLAGLL
ncbi:MAG: tetratricopeptide repeat protein [Bryobacteraceae bacterium]|jgi:tetratricopeptide (TPR) repeat protein